MQFLETTGNVFIRKDAKMAAISLFWNTNVIAMTSCEKARYQSHLMLLAYFLQRVYKIDFGMK